MMIKNHESVLLVMIERTTLVTILEKLQSKNADEEYEKCTVGFPISISHG
jgi:IS30 family transposase